MAENRHPSKSITATINLEKFDTTTKRWIFEKSDLIYHLKHGDSTTLDCNVETGFTPAGIAVCNIDRRYTTIKACFDDDSDCSISTSVPPPPNPNVPAFSCVTECSNGSNLCPVIPYNLLDATQKAAISRLRFGMQVAPLPYQFPANSFTDIFKPFSPKPSDCENRTDSIDSQNNFTERTTPPNTCHASTQFPNPVPIYGTTNTFSTAWLDLWPNLDGTLTRNRTNAKIAFRLDLLNLSPQVTVKIDNPSPAGPQTEIDVLDSLNFLGSPKRPGMLVMSGKNFMCVAVNDVPVSSNGSGVVHRRRPRR